SSPTVMGKATSVDSSSDSFRGPGPSSSWLRWESLSWPRPPECGEDQGRSGRRHLLPRWPRARLPHLPRRGLAKVLLRRAEPLAARRRTDTSGNYEDKVHARRVVVKLGVGPPP